MRRFGLLLAAALLSAAPAWAAGLTEAQVRAFVAQQERKWNAGELDAYFAAFRPDAVFTDQYRTPSGQIVPYGSSDLAKARAQSRKFRAQSKLAEKGEIGLDGALHTHIDACLGCMACVPACPSGVQYDKLLEAVRPQLERNVRRPWTDRVFRATIFALFPYRRRLRAAANHAS